MFSRDIPSYPLDLTGQADSNKVINEYGRRTDTEMDKIFVPQVGPYYIASMVLTNPETNTPYVEDKDYVFFGICSELTAFVKNKEVGMAIQWINPAVTEWYASYQVVGHFSYLQRELLYLTESVIDDDRPIWYKDIKNKPLWFPPELHRHDVRYELHSFADIITCVKRIAELKKNQINPVTTGVTHLVDNLSARIDEWEASIQKSLAQHTTDENAHGLTAAQVALGNVENFLTANLTETLNGSRRDRHVTMDNVDQAIRQSVTSLTQLTKSGSLPLLRFGSNSFIPVPITGSFEGQGANNYTMGFNVEPNGDALILNNRNDGRVNGLYFMSNSESGAPVDKWRFAAYRYQHQTATDDGVSLFRIVQGSSGKFLIVGGNDKSGNQRWYYTTGNGTFDPDKHILTPFPDDIIDMINGVAGNTTTANGRISVSSISSTTFPERIMLWVPVTGSWIMNSPWRLNFYDLPEGDEDKTSFSGVELPSDHAGLLCWEYSLTEKVWRQVTFTYTPAGYPDKTYTAPLYCPFRYKIVKITEDSPRLDNRNFPYGLKAYAYIFNYPITIWTNRRWSYTALDKYDAERDVIGVKFYDTDYGYDSRPFTQEGTNFSYGIVLKNRTITGTTTHFDVTNGYGLEETLYTFDTTQGGTKFVDYTGPNSSPHSDSIGRNYPGNLGSQYWLEPGLLYSAGSVSYGAYPIGLSRLDVRDVSVFATVESWVNGKLDADKRTVINYNESNPAGFYMGAHSVFYLQLDPDDTNTYGGVSYSSGGMVFRKQAALDANGLPREPYVNFTLYNVAVKGYPLDNTSYTFTGSYRRPYVTSIFSNRSDNRRREYMKCLIGHQPFARDSDGGVSNGSANHVVEVEHEVVLGSDSFDIVATKKYDLKDALTTTLFPYMIEQGKAKGYKILAPNIAATYRIGFPHIASTKYERLLVCTAIAFQEGSNVAVMLSTCFNLTGGTLSDGVVSGATITPVGNVLVNNIATVTDDVYKKYIVSGQGFPRNSGYANTQPRDLARQMDNGKSFCILGFGLHLTVKANIIMPCTAMIISENGVEESWGFEHYWTAGQYRYFYHPYYGVVNRTEDAISITASQIGYPYIRDISTKSDFVIDKSLRVLGNSNYLQSAYTVYISTDQNVTVNGTPYTLASKSIDLTTLDSDPSNSTYYLYLVYGSEGPEYRIVTNPLPETASRALLSVIKTNKDSIYEIENYNVFSMNGFRISAIRHGSVIPSATGSIDAAGQAKGWVDN